jgi:hypothetical protein
MSILGGLLSSPISRLAVTNDYIKKTVREEMDAIVAVMSPTGSFKAYREQLLRKQFSECFVPFLGVYLSDLTFMYDGNPDFVDAPDGGPKYIFYEKNELMDKVMEEIRGFQQLNGAFLSKKKPIMHSRLSYQYLKRLPSIPDENVLYEFSTTLEPRGCKKTDVL